MAELDGNGWVECRCGHRHWGLHGAAGLALLRPAADTARLLLQLRASWTHEGGSWGLPGGARDSHEDTVAAALREAAEEAGVRPGRVRVLGSHPGVDHGLWRYTYVIALDEGATATSTGNAESQELRWVPLPEVPGLPLHPALRLAWPALAHELSGPVARP